MKTITFLMIFAFAAMGISAQNRTTMDILKAYRWEAPDNMKGDVLVNLFKTFTNTTYKNTIVYDDETLEDNYQYYLSDTREHTFDQSKVGTVQYGEYIIAKQMDTGKVSCYMIIELNDTKFSFLYLPAPGEQMLGVGVVTRYAKPK